MPLNKAILEAALLAALTEQANKTQVSDDPAVSRQQLATKIADAIDLFVKSGLVNTTVTGTSPSGPVTGTGTGSVS